LGHLPWLIALWGQRGVLELWDGTRKNDKHQLLTRTCTKPNTRWLVHSWSTFGAGTSHGQIRTHKTYHGLDLEEATTFPFMVYFLPLHKTHIQMTFCPRLTNGNFEILKVGTSTILGPCNFVSKPLIEMRSKAKL